MKMRMVAILLAALLGLGVAACGGDDDSVSQEELEQATEEAAEEAREEAESAAELDELREELRELRKRQDRNEGRGDDIPDEGTTPPPPDSDSSAGVPGDAEDCGGGVLARADTTSCAFALNVAATYFSTPNNSAIDVYSPATGQTYRMSCSGGSPIVCTGGDNAAVYILVS